MPIRNWKRPAEVRKIRFIRNAASKDASPKHPGLVFLGAGNYGNVYLGKMRFDEGRAKRVAIKVFKTPLTDAAADGYQLRIDELRTAGVNLPPMGMVKMPTQRSPHGEWVQVSRLFGKTGDIKITGIGRTRISGQRYHKTPFDLRKAEAIEMAKIAGAGYYPKQDINMLLDGKRVIPLDFDEAHGKPQYVPWANEYDMRRRNAFKLDKEIRLMSMTGAEHAELVRACMEALEPFPETLSHFKSLQPKVKVSIWKRIFRRKK